MIFDDGKSAAAVLAVMAAMSPGMAVSAAEPPTMAGVLQESSASDWRAPEPANLLYLTLDSGLVVFELAPEFAPRLVANIRLLVEQRFFDGLAVLRSQENYVVQWGDPNAGSATARSYGAAAATLEPEFYRPRKGLPFIALDSVDTYADEVGFVGDFPAASDGERAWLAHCHGMLGVGRANEPESGNGAELYVVIGHAPRHLDRNVALIGRAVYGLERLSTLPRGTGAMGFYETPAENVVIRSIRFGDEIPVADRLHLRVMRTDTDTFQKLIEARRNRVEEWFVDRGGKVGLCNVPLPVMLDK